MVEGMAHVYRKLGGTTENCASMCSAAYAEVVV
jgi:hypothetical protein